MEIKQYEAMLSDAEARLKRLRALYDQWFAGVERIEPQQQKRDFETMLTTLRREQPRNTALRFRFNQVIQRYTTYTTYWRRIARQIEDGTYKRDVIRARRLTEALPPSDPPPPRQDSYEIDVDMDFDRAIDDGLDAALTGGASSRPPAARPAQRPMPPISPFAMPDERTANAEPARSFPAPPLPRVPGAPPIPIGAKRPPPPPPGALRSAAPPGAARPPGAGAGHNAPGIADDQMQRIYQRYVDARRQNQERTDVKFESVAKSVRDMMPKLMQKHAGKNIDFEVVVRDGKVALKPVAK